MHIKNNHPAAILWILTHCFFIVGVSALARSLSERYHVFEIVFFYNFFTTLLLLPWFLKSYKRTGKVAEINKLQFYIVRSAIGVVSMCTLFYALTLVSFTDVSAITLTNPLVGTAMAVFFLREKIGFHRALGLIVGFIGACIIIRPGTSAFNPASLLVVACVVMWSINTIVIKVMSRTEPVMNQVFYVSLLTSLMSLPLAVYKWQTPNMQDLLWLFLVGVLFLISLIAVSNAFKLGDVVVVLPFTFSLVVFASVLSYFVFNEPVMVSTIIGSLLITSSAVYVAYRESGRKEL